ncbi:NAD(P)-binding protein [Didymella exigua CBS 183.55]|uniref:NAD(P)-binding protein n=1 Tax=Didymella exigua CBS 183.55 TaxID=1150837 RepID=A0A6A5RVM3_9PLEO|nr:NAD(P)-binding protein [Didymella exigua CBS 183.55]KAF1931400.1 NAD(P)-binding protein [Didymella exigua CBS 183.55]
MSSTADPEIILVTGGNNGIGFDTVAALIATSTNYHVIIGSRNLDKGRATLEKIRARNHPGTVSLVQLDVTSDSSITSAFTSISQSFGRLDVLVNNAGICPEPAANTWPTRKELRAIFETNVSGPTLVTQAAIPLLKKSKDPRIINVTSSLGSISTRLNPDDIIASANYPAYRMSKAGVNMLTAFTQTVGGMEGVKTWSFCPGYVVTDLGGDRKLKEGLGVDSSETSARGILEIVRGERDAEVGRFVERDGKSRGW